MMSNEAFDGQILVEKLSKLNNSQQSIESLSCWCISHRKKAKQIVENWDKLFNSSQREQRVSFLYLANDILQNSRRKGSEFVNEFWKVLPAALKHVFDNGNEYGKKAVTRLVDIWEERKVFGSRGQGLKDGMLGKNPSPQSVSNGKSSNAIKIVKRDAHAVRIKLAVGGVPEKILTAFQSVLDGHLNEDAALNKCNSAVHNVGEIEKDVNSSSTQGKQSVSALVDELQEQENVLKQCVGQLESAETTRNSLIFMLREALKEQETKLEEIQTQLQMARGQIDLAGNIKKRLTSSNPLVGPTTTITIDPMSEVTRAAEHNLLPIQPTSTSIHPLPLTQPMVSFAPLKTADEDNKKAAAAVAAKLAASTSSALMLTSVLSSLVAEEAAFMNGSLNSTCGFSSGSIFPPGKRPKLEKPMSVSDVSNSDISSSAFVSSSSTSMQAPFAPPPPQLPSHVQSGVMVGVMPYGYGASGLPPPPPLPHHIAMGLLSRPISQPPQQQPATGGYFQQPGLGFYGQGSQSATQPVPRQ